MQATGRLNDENLSGLPLNQEWQRVLLEMIATGVDAKDAVETMLSTSLGNLVSLYGAQQVVTALLPLVMGMLKSLQEKPDTAH